MKKFVIDTVIQNEQLHYSVVDSQTGQIIHCELNELNDTLYEMMEE